MRGIQNQGNSGAKEHDPGGTFQKKWRKSDNNLLLGERKPQHHIQNLAKHRKGP